MIFTITSLVDAPFTLAGNQLVKGSSFEVEASGRGALSEEIRLLEQRDIISIAVKVDETGADVSGAPADDDN